jgi:hypothetical protein
LHALPHHTIISYLLQKEEKTPKAAKVGRRLSARVGDFFKPKPKAEIATQPKVDEHPPKIDEPTPIAPLENPATEEAAAVPAVEEAKPVEAAAVEEPKPTEASPAETPAAPVVAAAA